MRFILPEYLLLLLALPLFILGAVIQRRGVADRVRLLVGKRLQPLLYHPPVVMRAWAGLSSLIIALLLLIVSLASPSGASREEPEKIAARSIMIAIDVSRSMFATDLQPNRFHAAKASALELLDRFSSERIGLIAFSGTAWVQAPLTLDHQALRDTLEQLDTPTGESPDWIPRDGSDLPSAVRLAVRTLQKHAPPSTSLIILSDGENHHLGVPEAASEAAAAKVTVFSVGFGTTEGSTIPDPSSTDGNFYDRDGSLVISSLNSDPLALLCRITGGTYSEGAGRRFLSQVETEIEGMASVELEGSNRRIESPLFQWFLVPSILFFAAGMVLISGYPLGRRKEKRKSEAPVSPVLSSLLIFAFVFSFAFPSQAAPLLPTPAARALTNGDPEKALLLFEREIRTSRGERKAKLNLGAAAAAYRVSDYPTAQQYYSGALLSTDLAVQKQAHFGLGNASFYRGLRSLAASPESPSTLRHWSDSISHFSDVLKMEPSNKKAAENLAYVKRRFEEHSAQLLSPTNPEEGSNENPAPPERSKKEPEGEPQTNEPKQPNPSTPPSSASDNSPPTSDSIPQPDEPENTDRETNPPPQSKDPAPGETSEEFARRILRDNADFETKLIPRKLSKGQRSRKDW